MTVYRLLGLFSGILSVCAYVPYVVSTISKKTKPHPFSWLLWGILGGVSLITYFGVGARDTLPLAIVSFVGPSILFLLSIKYWSGSFSRFDYMCLTFSLIAIAVYIIFHAAAIALTINLAGDFLAALPTIKKTYHDSSSENFSTWFLFALSAIVSLFAISKWSYGIVIFPLYLAVFESFMSVLVFSGRRRKA
jgi:hypothetical protein